MKTTLKQKAEASRAVVQ